MAINSNPEIHRLVICANVFIRKDGKILVLKRSPLKKFAPNIISPVGGKVAIDENPYEAAVREAREETGVEIENLKLEACLLEIHPESPASPNNWLVFYFSADYKSGEIRNTDEGELLLLSIEEIKASNLFVSASRVMDKMLDPKAGTIFGTFYLDSAVKSVISEKIYSCRL